MCWSKLNFVAVNASSHHPSELLGLEAFVVGGVSSSLPTPLLFILSAGLWAVRGGAARQGREIRDKNILV